MINVSDIKKPVALFDEGGVRTLTLEDGTSVEYTVWIDRARRVLTAKVRRGRITLEFGPASYLPDHNDRLDHLANELRGCVSGTLTHWVSNFEADLRKLLG